MRKTFGIFLAAFLPLCVFATAPQLDEITPAGGQRGTEVQLSFHGNRLQDAEEIICYEPGIEVQPLSLVTTRLSEPLLKLRRIVRWVNIICAPRTQSGLSELRTFFVGPYPVISEVRTEQHPRAGPKNCDEYHGGRCHHQRRRGLFCRTAEERRTAFGGG